MFSRATGTRSPSFSSTGSSAVQGRHQGAQKSTMTGSAAIASSNVAGPSSRMPWMLQPPSECREPQPRYVHDRLEEDRSAHLRDAFGAVGEPDRHFDDGEALAKRAVRPLDLEGVALRVDSAQIDRLEDAAPVALEAAGEIADAHAENEPRIERAAPGDDS